MLIGLGGLGAATLLLAFVSSLPVMIVARCFQGIAAASTWVRETTRHTPHNTFSYALSQVAGLALLADYYPATELGPVMGAVSTSPKYSCTRTN